MKKVLISILLISAIACSKSDNASSAPSGGSCGEHNGKTLYKGPDGGCYYINSSGNKTYVDRTECNC